ncbi:unnamed protein product [Phytophthora fragariaefolia]|uniref:Unnamed protein product n=1 Tax=Phytophthora fragariaefolia TaxID=1490495 RepID=A0A9W6Y3V1_9STRA|nr:unnamed protein product [Phytophthora fragariaefolia]
MIFRSRKVPQSKDVPDQDAIPKADYRHCDAIASEILRIKREHPDTEIKAMAGDGRWHLSMAAMETGITQRFFNYHWVDDHINVAADVGTNCEDMERSLRYAMTTIIGSGAVNEDKFTEWNTSQKILGLQFETIAETIAIPAAKIAKARNLVASANSVECDQEGHAAQNGEDPKNFSPHSFRAGGATNMYRAGVDAMTIQFHGRWVSDTFKTYTNLCTESVTSLAANMVTGSNGDSTLH